MYTKELRRYGPSNPKPLWHPSKFKHVDAHALPKACKKAQALNNFRLEVLTSPTRGLNRVPLKGSGRVTKGDLIIRTGF